MNKNIANKGKKTPNEKQLSLLNFIVKDYISFGIPVSSGILKKRHDLPFSSATIRNDMVILEEYGYIEKSYFSSGRIPTNKGYEFYISNIHIQENINNKIKAKIEALFDNRTKNIDKIIDEVVKIIASVTNTLTVTKNTYIENSYIQDIKFYPLKNTALIIVVDSNGRIFNNEIEFNKDNLEKIKKVFNLMSERLIGIKLENLPTITKNLSELIAVELKEIENEFKKFIKNLFKNLNTSAEKTNGLWNIVKFDSYQKKEQIANIFKMIEENTIWDLISRNKHIYNENIEIVIDLEKENLDDIAIVNKTFDIKDSRKKIAFIGKKNQDYEELLDILMYLDKKIKE